MTGCEMEYHEEDSIRGKQCNAVQDNSGTQICLKQQTVVRDCAPFPPLSPVDSILETPLIFLRIAADWVISLVLAQGGGALSLKKHP